MKLVTLETLVIVMTVETGDCSDNRDISDMNDTNDSSDMNDKRQDSDKESDSCNISDMNRVIDIRDTNNIINFFDNCHKWYMVVMNNCSLLKRYKFTIKLF